MSFHAETKRPFRIFIGDLEYDSIYTVMTIPLNIGYLAAYLDDQYGSELEITLFKYPKKLEKALNESPPDMLCLSYFSWNARLDMVMLNMAKRLNPRTITVMGGPNIRRKPDEIKNFLREHPNLDYYIMDYGSASEEYLGELVGEILAGNEAPKTTSCATIIDDEFYFDPKDWRKKSKNLELPSPFLSGWLDEFLNDYKLIPIIETNRGCPFKCVFCTFGDHTLSIMRLRPLEQVFQEIDYVIDNSAGQKKWMIADANFGLFERDVEIAKKLRRIKEENPYPYEILLWDAKNSNERVVEIYKILGKQNRPLIAIQSADSDVSDQSGRGRLNHTNIKDQVDFFHDKGMETKTDIILGLPGESKASHFYTLKSAFDLGFDWFVPKELRMMQGIKYEEREYREKYGIKTRFRPIFGAYGTYDKKKVFEIEESVRETKDMSSDEMSDFKVHHFLITYAWSGGVFKPILRLGQKNGVNPLIVMDRLSVTRDPLLSSFFDRIRNDIRNEYFDTEAEMIAFYERPDNFKSLMNGFMKLIYLYTALLYQNVRIMKAMEEGFVKIIGDELISANRYNSDVFEDMVKLTELLACKNLLDGEISIKDKFIGENLATILMDDHLAEKKYIEAEIYRPKDIVDFCYSELYPNGRKDFSLQNFSRFFERKGLELLVNKINIIN